MHRRSGHHPIFDADLSRADFDAGETYLTLMERNYEATQKGAQRMNESPIVLACEDVTLGYEHKPLLEHLTLTVRAGDYLCIVGESGSGKSTLLRSLLGLLSPLAGKIDCPAQREGRLGYLPQQTPTQRDFPATVTEVVLSGFSNRRARFFYTAEEKSRR